MADLGTGVETLRAVSARSFERGVAAAESLAADGASVLLVHDDVAVQVDPGDDEATITANYDATVAAMTARAMRLPLLSDKGRTVQAGDVVETTRDDHFTRIPAGSFGIMTNLRQQDGDTSAALTVRYARRTVDYETADLDGLRFAR